MRFSENRPLAFGVLALVIVAALILGGGGALMKQRTALESRFDAPSESIGAELREMRTNAAALLGIVNRSTGANADFAAALNTAIESLDRAQNIAEKHAASLQLSTAVENCYQNLTTLSPDDMTAKDARYAYRNFTSAQLRISHDDYNRLAEDFNQKLQGFPAGLIAALRGVKPISLFR